MHELGEENSLDWWPCNAGERGTTALGNLSIQVLPAGWCLLQYQDKVLSGQNGSIFSCVTCARWILRLISLQHRPEQSLWASLRGRKVSSHGLALKQSKVFQEICPSLRVRRRTAIAKEMNDFKTTKIYPCRSPPPTVPHGRGEAQSYHVSRSDTWVNVVALIAQNIVGWHYVCVTLERIWKPAFIFQTVEEVSSPLWMLLLTKSKGANFSRTRLHPIFADVDGLFAAKQPNS